MIELYRLLRDPAVLTHPLQANQAAKAVAWYRDTAGWQHCAWENGLMEKLQSHWQDDAFPARRGFDLILALTLKHNGVKEFHTRNVKDFEPYGFFNLFNPLA